jgi:hypothetical protein
MMNEVHTTAAGKEDLATLSEERLAHLLQELGARRNALREELGRLERAVRQVEVELARRGSGG